MSDVDLSQYLAPRAKKRTGGYYGQRTIPSSEGNASSNNGIGAGASTRIRRNPSSNNVAPASRSTSRNVGSNNAIGAGASTSTRRNASSSNNATARKITPKKAELQNIQTAKNNTSGTKRKQTRNNKIDSSDQPKIKTKKARRNDQGTVALQDNDNEYKNIGANEPLRPKHPKKPNMYIPVAQRSKDLSQRKSSRIKASEMTKPEKIEEMAVDDAQVEMDIKLVQALSKAMENSKKIILAFRVRLYKILSGPLKVNPKVLASYLLNVSSQIPIGESLIDWPGCKVEDLIKLFKPLYARVPGFKEEVQLVFDKIVYQITFENKERVNTIVEFYVKSLLEDFLLPSKCIWGYDGTWSEQHGTFLALVLELMEYSKRFTHILDLFRRRENGIADIIICGKDFLLQLERYIPLPRGQKMKDVIKNTCEIKLVERTENVLKYDQMDGGKSLVTAFENCGIIQQKINSIIWKAVVNNISKTKSLLSQTNALVELPKRLCEKNNLKECLRRNPLLFLESIEFPPKLYHLLDSIVPLVLDCISNGIIKTGDVLKWQKRKMEKASIITNAAHKRLLNYKFE